ncbi:MAG: methyltransferase domain-containing protein [bacterium JZ-2024 1]
MERLRSGIDMIDLGTGQGHAVNVMAWAFPNSRFVGVVFSTEGIEAARAEAASWNPRTRALRSPTSPPGCPGNSIS